ncbi:MAG: TrkA C-terminal domain-containing protein, partial [Syntrophales bacterium]|nr:TrkA C-terminal domain-containing protein [Syntrophales bacterium]
WWRSLGVDCLYGDMADPEMIAQLPLDKTRWVVSTVRSGELSMALLNILKNKGYAGKVALTAASEQEAEQYQKAGAQVVFRPFRDAAEQAADSLTDAMEVLPDDSDLPISFREIRIASGSVVAGETLRNIPLRSETSVSIIAVSRAGKAFFVPDPDFQIYPGDRLIVVGLPTELKEAEALLSKRDEEQLYDDPLDHFELEEVSLGADSGMKGRTLADARFRQLYSVTVVGIRREKEQIIAPGPQERLQPGDHLLVIGSTKDIESLKKREPL